VSFTCPVCGAVSFHPEDEATGYCGRCHNFTALKPGDVIRVRRLGSQDEWCVGVIEKASLNGLSLLMRVIDGVLRPAGGGLIAAVIAILVEDGSAREVFTNTELEVEGRVDE
jgi:hypothetical protein